VGAIPISTRTRGVVQEKVLSATSEDEESSETDESGGNRVGLVIPRTVEGTRGISQEINRVEEGSRESSGKNEGQLLEDTDTGRTNVSFGPFFPRRETNGEVFECTPDARNGTVAKNPLGVHGVDAVQVSSHRGPPTDRPPDRPCIGKGVVRGCLQERAGTRHFISQLAFFARVGHSLSGNATPLQKMQIKVWTPSDCHASSQAGSSQQIWVQSWMHPRCGRFRVNGYVCCTRKPFPNLSRNLSLRGGFLPHPIQRRSMAQRDNRRSWLHFPATRPTGRCPVQPRPRWGQTK
jgi:hypothetical protein